jgi:hypothetical protein
MALKAVGSGSGPPLDYQRIVSNSDSVQNVRFAVAHEQQAGAKRQMPRAGSFPPKVWNNRVRSLVQGTIFIITLDSGSR